MKRESRLKSPSDFIKTFREGRRVTGPYFILYARKNDLNGSRLGVSISKSHFKLATRRNRIRRIAREIFRTEIAPRANGYDFVIASRGHSGSNIKEALKELKKLLARAQEDKSMYTG